MPASYVRSRQSGALAPHLVAFSVQLGTQSMYGVAPFIPDKRLLHGLLSRGRRGDTRLQGGLGYRTAHLLFQASGSFDLRNLSTEVDGWDSQYYSRGVRLSVAYLFGSKS